MSEERKEQPKISRIETIKKLPKRDLVLYIFGIFDAALFLSSFYSLAWSILNAHDYINRIVEGFFIKEDLLIILSSLLAISHGFTAYGFLRKRKWAFLLYYYRLPLSIYFLINKITYLFHIHKLYDMQLYVLIAFSMVLLGVALRLIITVIIHKNSPKYSDVTNNFSAKLERILITLFFFAILTSTTLFCINLIPRKYVRNPIRPGNFPAILIHPQNAYDRDYSTSSNDRTVKHSYGLSFFVDEPYPSEAVRKFFNDHLKSNGWQKLKYDLLNPNIPIYKNPLLPNLKTKLPDGTEGKWPLSCKEDWISNEEENISIRFDYGPDQDEKPDLSRVYVNTTLFKQRSWVNAYIKRYKQLHPEEFEQKTE